MTAPRTITRLPLGAAYNGLATVKAAGEILTVDTQDYPNLGMSVWSVWTLADPDEIPTERRLAIITTGMPMPEGQWKYLTSIATESYVWHVFTEVTA